MESTITLSKIIYGVYVPFVIVLIGFAVPMVTILLSVFAQGREEIANEHQEKVKKITEDIKVNESTKKYRTLMLVWQLLKQRYKLLVLNPNYYLPFLIIPPVISIIFSVLALKIYPGIFMTASVILLIWFQLFLWSMIKTIAEITAKNTAKKEERERTTLEVLQNILIFSRPESSRVKSCWFGIDGNKVTNNDTLPQVILGRESSWKINFTNADKDLAAKKV